MFRPTATCGATTGFHEFSVSFDYNQSTDGNLNVTINTNKKFGSVATEGLGYGDLTFVQCDKEQNWDAVNKKCCHKSCNPVSCTGPMLWQCNVILENNCTPKASLKHCQDGNVSRSFYGGKGQCAKNQYFSKTVMVPSWHNNVTSVKVTGKVWVFDNWNKEKVHVFVKNSKGKLLTGGNLTFTGKVPGNTTTFKSIRKCGISQRISGVPQYFDWGYHQF
jgi:hypothetical protein